MPAWISSKYIVLLFTIYVFAWTASYIFVVGLDFSYYIEYFVAGWLFSGGEIPALIWFSSILLTLGLGSVGLLVIKKMEPNKSG